MSRTRPVPSNEFTSNVDDILCTCEVKPLGLDFVLTAGCLLHDHCVCHDEHEHEQPECLWCDSFIALLKTVASLDDNARQELKRAYLKARKLKTE